ncbi:hypothetical protein ABEW59_25470 [Bacillus wiedmannii]|uniref:hypothetical protein n=1 Tax=Bacillus wiedmannii TaxID=1890302 RepID=UPI003D25B4E0
MNEKKPIFHGPIFERSVPIKKGYDNVVNIPETPLEAGRYAAINFGFRYTDQANPQGAIRVVEAYPNQDMTQFKVRFYNEENATISVEVGIIFAENYPHLSSNQENQS